MFPHSSLDYPFTRVVLVKHHAGQPRWQEISPFRGRLRFHDHVGRAGTLAARAHRGEGSVGCRPAHRRQARGDGHHDGPGAQGGAAAGYAHALGVVMERTCNELRGISCLALEKISPPRKEIV